MLFPWIPTALLCFCAFAAHGEGPCKFESELETQGQRGDAVGRNMYPDQLSCQDFCASNPKCLSADFRSDENLCYIYDGPTTLQLNIHAVFMVKKCNLPPAVKGEGPCKFESELETQGQRGDAVGRNMYPDQLSCQDFCASNPKCLSADFRSDENLCYIYDGPTTLQLNIHAVFMVKKCNLPPAVKVTPSPEDDTTSIENTIPTQTTEVLTWSTSDATTFMPPLTTTPSPLSTMTSLPPPTTFPSNLTGRLGRTPSTQRTDHVTTTFTVLTSSRTSVSTTPNVARSSSNSLIKSSFSTSASSNSGTVSQRVMPTYPSQHYNPPPVLFYNPPPLRRPSFIPFYMLVSKRPSFRTYVLTLCFPMNENNVLKPVQPMPDTNEKKLNPLRLVKDSDIHLIICWCFRPQDSYTDVTLRCPKRPHFMNLHQGKRVPTVHDSHYRPTSQQIKEKLETTTITTDNFYEIKLKNPSDVNVDFNRTYFIYSLKFGLPLKTQTERHPLAVTPGKVPPIYRQMKVETTTTADNHYRIKLTNPSAVTDTTICVSPKELPPPPRVVVVTFLESGEVLTDEKVPVVYLPRSCTKLMSNRTLRLPPPLLLFTGSGSKSQRSEIFKRYIRRLNLPLQNKPSSQLNNISLTSTRSVVWGLTEKKIVSKVRVKLHRQYFIYSLTFRLPLKSQTERHPLAVTPGKVPPIYRQMKVETTTTADNHYRIKLTNPSAVTDTTICVSPKELPPPPRVVVVTFLESGEVLTDEKVPVVYLPRSCTKLMSNRTLRLPPPLLLFTGSGSKSQRSEIFKRYIRRLNLPLQNKPSSQLNNISLTSTRSVVWGLTEKILFSKVRVKLHRQYFIYSLKIVTQNSN